MSRKSNPIEHYADKYIGHLNAEEAMRNHEQEMKRIRKRVNKMLKKHGNEAILTITGDAAMILLPLEKDDPAFEKAVIHRIPVKLAKLGKIKNKVGHSEFIVNQDGPQSSGEQNK